jgi:hypothetical protein
VSPWRAAHGFALFSSKAAAKVPLPEMGAGGSSETCSAKLVTLEMRARAPVMKENLMFQRIQVVCADLRRFC